MRKCFTDKQLRWKTTSTTKRAAFSLAELVVSVGILVLMLTLAGQVVSLTVKSTGQAKALTEVNQQLRVFERTLLEDLRYVNRDSSVIVIQGNPINAFWTRDHQEAAAAGNPAIGYPHAPDPERTDPWTPTNLQQPRADMLMVFTERPTTSNVHVGTTLPSNIHQVVIGHADLGEFAATTAAFTKTSPALPTDNTTTYRIPAEDWHLASRRVLVSHGSATLTPSAATLDDPLILLGATDVVENFNYEMRVLRPSTGWPLYWPEILNDTESGKPYLRSELDLTPPPTVAYGVNQFFLPRCASFKVEWCLDPQSDFVGGRLDGEKEILWFDPGDSPSDPDEDADPLRSLRTAIAEALAQGDIDREGRLTDLLEKPLGGYGKRYADPGAVGGGIEFYSLEERFGGAMPGGSWPPLDLAVFTARRTKPADPLNPTAPPEYGPEDIFPAALRITIDIYDRERRLERPIRHVIVAPVGS